MSNFDLHETCKMLSQAVYLNNKLQNINGWEYVNSFSNYKSGYYSEVYKHNNKVILSIRGTEIKEGKKEAAKDFCNDIQMTFVHLPRQKQDAVIAYKRLAQKYGKENIIITGHSLGGSLGQILGAEFGSETVTFGAYGVKYMSNIDINYTDNITNYGNAQDTVFASNIDSQIGKTYVLNNKISGNSFKKEYFTSAELSPHLLENLGDLSKGVEYKKEEFEKDKTPLFKAGIEYNDYDDSIFDVRNRVLYWNEVPWEEMDDELADVFLDQYFDNEKMPTKEELDKRVRLGNLIYVKDYTRSDGTKVSGYYRRYPE